MLDRRCENEGAWVARRWGDQVMEIRDAGAGDYRGCQDARSKPESRVAGTTMSGGPLYVHIRLMYIGRRRRALAKKTFS